MYHHLKNLHHYSTRSLLEESSKKSISKVSGVVARPTRQRLQPTRDCRPGGHACRRLPKDALDQIAQPVDAPAQPAARRYLAGAAGRVLGHRPSPERQRPAAVSSGAPSGTAPPPQCPDRSDVRSLASARSGEAAQCVATICLICSTTSGFISVVTSPTSSDSLESAARTRRMILPERVLGMSGTR